MGRIGIRIGFAVGLSAVGALLLMGCESREPGQASATASTPGAKETVGASPVQPSPTSRATATPMPTPTPFPTPEPEKRVTLTTTTTLRELASELKRQLGVEYAADDDVAATTISLDVKGATRAEVETLIREKTGVHLIYSDREIPEQWVHFAGER